MYKLNNEFLQGHDLIINTKDTNNSWPQGHIGIIEQNTMENHVPLCIIKLTNNYTTFIEELNLSSKNRFKLVKACLDSGYDPFQSITIGAWLYHNMLECINSHPEFKNLVSI